MDAPKRWRRFSSSAAFRSYAFSPNRSWFRQLEAQFIIIETLPFPQIDPRVRHQPSESEFPLPIVTCASCRRAECSKTGSLQEQDVPSITDVCLKTRQLRRKLGEFTAVFPRPHCD